MTGEFPTQAGKASRAGLRNYLLPLVYRKSRSSPSFLDYRVKSGALFQLIQKMKQRNRHNGVEQAQHQGALGFEVHLLAQQRARENPKDELMENKEKEAQDQADQRMIHIQPQAHRGGHVADDGLGNAEHT